MKLYADIVLPLAVKPFTFLVAEELVPILKCGMAVEVPLGARKLYAGIVWRLHNNAPASGRIKSITRTVRSEILVAEEQMALWEWIAEYYMCSLGEVMRAALPASLKPSAFSEQEFNDNLFALPVERYVALGEQIGSEGELNEAIESLGRAKAQQRAVVEFCDHLGGDMEQICGGEVLRTELTASPAVVKALVGRGIFRIVERESLPRPRVPSPDNLHPLTESQQAAFEAIKGEFEKHNTVLLQGVSSSGKTEIYMHLMAGTLNEGRSVLYLLPEIAVTQQLLDRIAAAFGNGITPYHSKYTVRNRTESYLRLARSGGGELVVGVRSAILLPLHNLGLVVVDEEHDRSFKQGDPSPRYSARDTAVWIATNLGAKTLLGSATPSLESYANAMARRYGYVVLDERYGSGRPPRIELSDTLRSAKRGERKGHFNKELRDAVDDALVRGRQAMLFQNRRGFAPYIECGDCGWTARCPHCGVTLTYYKAENRLRCNLCGYSANVPSKCPSCRVAVPEPCGFGTEKIEQTTAELFPSARVARLDGDTATSARRYSAIIDDFAAHRTDILVGTQMITKGFDFGAVDVVGVMNADNLLNYPDFRASERTFQTLTQFAGRAGRTDDAGRVVIQTAVPNDRTLQEVLRGDYRAMAESELGQRSRFAYPPFVRLVTITLRHANCQLLTRGAELLAARLQGVLGRSAVSDAHSPVVGRVADLFVVEIVVRIARGEKPQQTKSVISDQTARLLKEPLYRRIAVAFDVDPQ